jgi:hypothetical protein
MDLEMTDRSQAELANFELTGVIPGDHDVGKEAVRRSKNQSASGREHS